MTRLKLIFQKLSKKQQRAKRVATILSDIFKYLFGKNQLLWTKFRIAIFKDLLKAFYIDCKCDWVDWVSISLILTCDGTRVLRFIIFSWTCCLKGTISTWLVSTLNLRLLQITRLTFRVQTKQMKTYQPSKMSHQHFMFQLDCVGLNPATNCKIHRMVNPNSNLTYVT